MAFAWETASAWKVDSWRIEAGGDHGIEIVAGGFATQRSFVRQRVERLPDVDRDVGEFARVETRNDQTAVGHTGGEMPLIESGLRGFEEEAGRAGGKERRFQLEFRGAVERDDAEGLGADPAVHGRRRNGLVQGTQRGRGRNRGKKIRRVVVTGREFIQPKSCRVTKIGLRKTLGSGAQITARVAGISAAFGIAAEPIERIRRVGGRRILAQECGQLVVGIGLALR